MICVYTEGQKAGLTPHLGFDPAIGALCKRGINVDPGTFSYLVKGMEIQIKKNIEE